MSISLEETYAILYHENHPIRIKLIASLAMAGKTDEEIKALLPEMLKQVVSDNQEKANVEVGINKPLIVSDEDVNTKVSDLLVNERPARVL